jgi:hypothetical protein
MLAEPLTLRAVARFLAVTMMVVGFCYSFWLIFIGLFVFFGAKAEEQAAQRSAHRDNDSANTPPPTSLTPPASRSR